MDRLLHLIGNEHSFAAGNRELKFFAHHIGAPVVGALQVTCADEFEYTAAEAFHRGFAQELLPPLPNGRRAAMRIANFGGVYPWGAVRLVESRFATPRTQDAFKLIVAKVNSHVHVEGGAKGTRFGPFQRYGVESSACSALLASVDGKRSPLFDELEEALGSEGVDRIAMLRECEPAHRALFAAIASARIQARRVVLDIQDHVDTTPTYYLVLPSVSIHRNSGDGELWCGAYSLDRRDPEQAVELYAGLGDRPSEYRIPRTLKPLRVEEPDGIPEPRPAREHRRLIADILRTHNSGRPPESAEIAKIRRQHAESAGGHGPNYSKTALKMLMRAMAQLNPATAALLFFAEGAMEIHHAHRVHELARNPDDERLAQRLLDEQLEAVDELTPEEANHDLEALLERTAGR